jgi:PadR family transcriptional regulator, regulatory protein PadR
MSLGEFEQLLLLAILRRGDDAYGISIRDEIEDRTGRSASLGAVYTALDRLEEKKFVSSWLGGATAERGGRAKRFYRIEAAGQALLKESLLATKRMTVVVEHLLGGAQ